MSDDVIARAVEAFIVKEPPGADNLRGGAIFKKLPNNYLWDLWRSVGVDKGKPSSSNQCREMNRRYNIQLARLELYIWVCIVLLARGVTYGRTF